MCNSYRFFVSVLRSAAIRIDVLPLIMCLVLAQIRWKFRFIFIDAPHAEYICIRDSDSITYAIVDAACGCVWRLVGIGIPFWGCAFALWCVHAVIINAKRLQCVFNARNDIAYDHNHIDWTNRMLRMRWSVWALKCKCATTWSALYCSAFVYTS